MANTHIRHNMWAESAYRLYSSQCLSRQTAELLYSLEKMHFATHERLMKRLDKKENRLEGLAASLHAVTNHVVCLPQQRAAKSFCMLPIK